MKYWEIIVNKIIKAGFTVGWVSALDDYGRTVWIVDAHREGKRFVVRADEKLTAFKELGKSDLRVRGGCNIVKLHFEIALMLERKNRIDIIYRRGAELHLR
jgi:hypothetical protein